jgi:hypothetical protein
MEKEIQATVKLWAEHVKGGGQYMGDAMGDALASFAKSLCGDVSDEQITIFEQALTEGLRTMIIESESWNVEFPERGSSRRSLFVDYNGCAPLVEAANKAGINTLHLPIKSGTKTCLGFVWFHFGYSAQWQKLVI